MSKGLNRAIKSKTYLDAKRIENREKRNEWNRMVRAKLKAGTMFNDGLEFTDTFANDYLCEDFLIDLIYKDDAGNDNFTCPYCHTEKVEVYKLANKWFECSECHERFNVLTGSPFKGNRSGLRRWFYSIYVENVLNGGVTGGELERLAGLSRTTCANRLHIIRRYGYFQECFPKVVYKDKDDNFIPLVFSLDVMVRDGDNISRHIKHKRGYRGGPNKQLVLVIAQEGGHAIAYTVNGEDTESLIPIITSHIPLGATIYTDQAPVFKQLKTEYGYDLHTINHKSKEYGRKKDGKVITTNRVEGFHSFFQTGLGKFRNSITKKFTIEYLNAAIFRYNTGLMSEEEKFIFVLKNIFKYAANISKVKEVTIKTIRKRKMTNNNKYKQARTFFAQQRKNKNQLANSEAIAA